MNINGPSDLVEQLTALTRFLRERGAWFHPSLAVDCRENELSMHSEHAFNDRRSLLRIPLALMPAIDHFHWSVDWQDDVPHLAADPLGEASGDEVALMTQMIDIYNALDKLNQWRSVTPWVALREAPDMMAALFRGRANAPKAQKYHRASAADDTDALLLETFLGARAFNLSARHRVKAGRESAEQSTSVIMPVIDYFNHRWAAEGYSIHDTPTPPSMRVFGKPDPDTSELFVRYNHYDPLDTYLFYGFVDVAAPWLNSVPLTIDEGGKTLSVEAKTGLFKGQLPPALRDLRVFMPQITYRDELGVTLDKLVIPGARAPRALQRVLASFASALGISPGDRRAAVARMEEAVINRNEAYWADLADAASDLPADHSVHILCEHAQSHIAAYRENRPPLE